MSTTVSRGIESVALWPPPIAQQQDRVRARRAWPILFAPGSLESLVRASEPSTRIVFGRGQRVAAAAELGVGGVGHLRRLDLRGDQEQHERDRQPGDDAGDEPAQDAPEADPAPAGPAARERQPAAALGGGASSSQPCGGGAAPACSRRPPSSSPPPEKLRLGAVERVRTACRRRASAMRIGRVAGMAEGYVIGVDLGGTKLLAGAVDADLSVIHRTNRPVYGLSQDELVQMVADAVEEIRAAVGGEIEAIGFGIPCTFDSRTGMAVQAVNVPLKDIAFGDVMAERLGMPVRRRQRRELPHGLRVADRDRPGRDRRGAAHARHRDRRRAAAARRGLPRLDHGRRRDGPHGRRDERPPVPGQLPELGLPGVGRVRHARSCARRRWPSRAGPTPRSATRWRRAASSPAR